MKLDHLTIRGATGLSLDDSITGRHVWHGRMDRGLRRILDIDDLVLAVGEVYGSRAITGWRLRVFRRGVPMDHLALSAVDGGSSTPPQTVIDWDRVQRWFAQGCTVALYCVNEVHDRLNDVAVSLRGILGCETHFNAYITPSGGSSLDPHSDSMDVLVIHLYGSKIWEVGPDPATPDAASTASLSLTPGDLLFIPEGVHHVARAVGPTPSMHITVGLHWPTIQDVIRRDPACRRVLGERLRGDYQAQSPAAIARLIRALSEMGESDDAGPEAAPQRQAPLLLREVENLLDPRRTRS